MNCLADFTLDGVDHTAISEVAFAVLSANFLTSSATTANPALLTGSGRFYGRIQRQQVVCRRYH